MQRSRRRLVRSMLTLVALTGGLAVAAAAPASAATPNCSGPDGQTTQYTVSHLTRVYTPTNLTSPWQEAATGGSITHVDGRDMQVSASVTATVTAEAGLFFAKASASLGLTVGAAYSRSQQWSNTIDIPKTPGKIVRMHLYWVAYTFQATKQYWQCRGSSAGWVNAAGYPAWIYHAPRINKDDAVYKLDWANE